MNSTKKCIPFTRRFGFELEFTGNSTSRDKLKRAVETVKGEVARVMDFSRQHDNAFWACKTDSTCGFEVASRVLLTSDDLKQALRVTRAIAKSGAKVSTNCGFHVHIEVTDYNRNKLARLVNWWVKMERFIMDLMEPSRKDNNFCQRLGQFYKGNRRYATDELLEPISHERCYALNVQHFKQRKTIEFRVAHGTNDFVDVKNWVRFLLVLVEFARAAKQPEDCHYLLPAEIFKTLGFFDENLSDGLREVRTWLFDTSLKHAERDIEQQLIEMAQDELSID